MKKILALMLAMVICLSLWACSKEKNDIPETTHQMLQETEANKVVTEPTKAFKPETDLPGTWKATYVVVDGVELTVAEVSRMGEFRFENCYMVFKTGGKVYFSPDERLYDWSCTEDTAMVDGMECSIVEGKIIMESERFSLIWEKVSDSQDLTDLPENQTEPSTEPSTEPMETSLGMRPEFKEAMDAYKEFYDEYCDFMVKYKENPTDLTLLTQYGKLMNEVLEMDEAFKAWGKEELNDAELKYYLEVNNRVMQKMIDVIG